MELIPSFLVYLALASIVSSPEVGAQSPTSQRSSLDTLLQDYAYRAFVRPRTGKVFDQVQFLSNFSGIKLAAIRLRRWSLRTRGVVSYKEFKIPIGVIVQPRVVRLVLVYQNLGNWSSTYYGASDYSFLAPVLGLLAYDGSNLSATNLPQLDIMASKEPISIQFTDVRPVPTGLTPKCISFGLNGSPEFSDLTSNNVCSTQRQGHFSIVVEPARKNRSKAWKIAAPVVGGSVVLVLFALLVVWLQRYRQNKRIDEMERQAEIGEAFHMTSIGNTRAPMAVGTRTPPILESEYAP